MATVLGSRPRRPTPAPSACRCPSRTPHLAGQHYVIRLTAPDGYTASRSYSIASAPDGVGRVRDHRRAAGGGGGVDLPPRRGRAGRRVGGAGPDREVLRVGRGLARAAGRRRLGRRPPHGHAPPRPPPREVRHACGMVVSVRSPDDLLFADELPGPEPPSSTPGSAPADDPRPPGRIGLADLAPAVAAVGPERQPPSCAGRPASATPPPTSSGRPASPSSASGWSASAPPADASATTGDYGSGPSRPMAARRASSAAITGPHTTAASSSQSPSISSTESRTAPGVTSHVR